MLFGVYVHIPFCIQKCHYCDFITMGLNQGLSKQQYEATLIQEIQNRSAHVPFDSIDTIYFGGGTPSLMSPKSIVSVIQALTQQGFKIKSEAEITIEINPGTITESDLNYYLENGVNRFSVGAQTFDQTLLEKCKREHSVTETKETLKLLNKYNSNFTLDILYTLPGQSLDTLKVDVEKALEFSPPHISSYLLNVPKEHVMQVGRVADDQQEEMFYFLSNTLTQNGYKHYEISNYAKPGFESAHNNLYWNDHSYWGIGLGAHSYFNLPDKKVRFWNAPNHKRHKQHVDECANPLEFPKNLIEFLQPHEYLTDFLHTFLRTQSGLTKKAINSRFSHQIQTLIYKKLASLKDQGYLYGDENHYALTQKGMILSNNVFFQLTFAPEDLTNL